MTYKHLIATVEIRGQHYAYHFASQDLQEVQTKQALLSKKLADKMLRSLYKASIVESSHEHLDALKEETFKRVRDLESFVRLVNDKKLITIAHRLPDREMNSTEQLLDWFNGD
ncbi:hypothetical protein [Pediococcus cellicola]|uniref:Uncharacterized protein n=1 Tax=Pediococcus cellicola TaxID=319652 RepID=A0A0R2IWC7_9LACO|nr:hypothetical protein [Pediococcus cellicola]KRN67253.1 hypothetical protein IV80_GL000789 [Pediococcus cellicola]GEL14895.1 hypothetical protein PCE01_06970 [Pediococcus cellicola]